MAAYNPLAYFPLLLTVIVSPPSLFPSHYAPLHYSSLSFRSIRDYRDWWQQNLFFSLSHFNKDAILSTNGKTPYIKYLACTYSKRNCVPTQTKYNLFKMSQNGRDSTPRSGSIGSAPISCFCQRKHLMVLQEFSFHETSHTFQAQFWKYPQIV